MKKRIFLQLFLSLACFTLCLSASETAGIVSAQPMVALFPTNSLVPTLPYAAYQACDKLLAQAILVQGCRLRGQQTAAAALRACGVVKVEDLSTGQAEQLLQELSGEALVQLTILGYKVYERRESGRFFRAASPRRVWMAEISGQIQVWRKGRQEPDVLTFSRAISSMDPAMGGQDGGKMDANGFGQEALRLSLRQALKDFHETKR